MDGGIIVEGFVHGYSNILKILNIYAPYNKILKFWVGIFQSGILANMSLIVVGDFNFMMSNQGIWGDVKSEDSLTYFFTAKFEEMKLVDVVPNVMIPTWSNGRCRGVGLAKWLDEFFLAKNLCEDFGKYNSW